MPNITKIFKVNVNKKTFQCTHTISSTEPSLILDPPWDLSVRTVNCLRCFGSYMKIHLVYVIISIIYLFTSITYADIQEHRACRHLGILYYIILFSSFLWPNAYSYIDKGISGKVSKHLYALFDPLLCYLMLYLTFHQCLKKYINIDAWLKFLWKINIYSRMYISNSVQYSNNHN